MDINKNANDIRVALLTRDTQASLEDAVNSWLAESGPTMIHKMEFSANYRNTLVYTVFIVHENLEGVD